MEPAATATSEVLFRTDAGGVVADIHGCAVLGPGRTQRLHNGIRPRRPFAERGNSGLGAKVEAELRWRVFVTPLRYRYTERNQRPISLDAAGFLKVLVVVNGACKGF